MGKFETAIGESYNPRLRPRLTSYSPPQRNPDRATASSRVAAM